MNRSNDKNIDDASLPMYEGAMTMDPLQRISYKSTTKQETKQESISLKEQLKDCFPKDLNALLYTLFILVYIVCAVIHFTHTGDITMFTILLPYLSAYAGIQKVTDLLPWSKKGNNSKAES